MNVSLNEANQYSAIYSGPHKLNETDPNNKYGTLISYSSFAHNNATSGYCIYLSCYGSSANIYHIKNSNIIYNIGANTIQNGAGTTTIYDSCIMKNGDPTFLTFQI